MDTNRRSYTIRTISNVTNLLFVKLDTHFLFIKSKLSFATNNK